MIHSMPKCYSSSAWLSIIKGRRLYVNNDKNESKSNRRQRTGKLAYVGTKFFD